MADSEQLPRLPGCLRVSHQPIMFAGLTGSEFFIANGAGFVAFFIVTVIMWPVLGALHFSILIGCIAGVTAGLTLRTIIVRAKRQRPEGYPLQLALRFRHGIEPIPDLVSAEGHWDPIRHVK